MDHEDGVNALNLETLDDVDQLYDGLTMGPILKSNGLSILQPSTFSLAEGDAFLNSLFYSTEIPLPINAENYCLAKLPP